MESLFSLERKSSDNRIFSGRVWTEKASANHVESVASFFSFWRTCTHFSGLIIVTGLWAVPGLKSLSWSRKPYAPNETPLITEITGQNNSFLHSLFSYDQKFEAVQVTLNFQWPNNKCNKWMIERLRVSFWWNCLEDKVCPAFYSKFNKKVFCITTQV